MMYGTFDVVVLGGGAAGMASALEMDRRGWRVAIIERESRLGGILLQCIHTGFGLIEFDEELSGPEVAERLSDRIPGSKITVFVGSTVIGFESMEEGKGKAAGQVVTFASAKGVTRLESRAVVLAMGCRERNRGNVRIPGTRPAGIFTAGLAQRLVNIDGIMPGREVVIIGSGDIGLVMARRMAWSGARVHAVVEILPRPSGLPRNVVQCLNDFGIPLYLSHVTTAIKGKDRVRSIEVCPVENGALAISKAFELPCDTLLLSVGLVPENELSRDAGVQLNPATGGPRVDSQMMSSKSGVFACGNVLHVHDLVDNVVEEARRTGAFVSFWLEGTRPSREIKVKAGSNVRYVCPGSLDPASNNQVSLRSLVVKDGAQLEIRAGEIVVKRIMKNHVRPSEMITFNLGTTELGALAHIDDATIEISIP